jgi:2-keto-4-pentenoate hydratase
MVHPVTGADDPRIAAGMRRQSALRQERIAAGQTVIGWKVGFGAPAALEKLRLTAPLVGFLLDTAQLSAGATVSLAGWQKPVAEPEIAVHLGRDLPAGADDDAVRSAIAALGPAIEIADVDAPMDDVEAILAGGIFQRHVVLGPRDPARAGARLAGLTGAVMRNGEALAVPADLEQNTGRLVDIVRHVANVTADLGDGLHAGQFIIAGSVIPPLFVTPGESVTFTLSPIGTVSVGFVG